MSLPTPRNRLSPRWDALSDHLDATLDPLAQSAHRTLDAATQTLQTTDEAVRRVQADASTALRDLDALLVDAHRQLDARGGELSRTLTAADRAVRQAETLLELAKWSGRAGLAVSRRSRGGRARSRRQRQLSAQFRRNSRAKPERPAHGAGQPMKQAAAHSCPGRRFFPVAVLAFFGAAMCAITACSLSGPPPAEYVLGAMPAATATTLSQTGLPVVEVNRIQLPDYLDTTDILERRGNQLVPSPTGRWGERLSVGITRALTASLAARLPASGRDGNAAWASDTADPGRCGCL